MIEIGKTYRRQILTGFRYAKITKIDLFNGLVYYNTTDVDNGISGEEYYDQYLDIEDFIELYLNH